MRSAGQKDKNGLEIFEGDSVLWPHMWFQHEGGFFTSYKLVKIKYDQKSHRFILGDIHNNWTGSELTKIDPQGIIDLRKLGVRHGCDVSVKKGEYWVPDPWIKWGLTKEQYDEQNKKFREMEFKAFWGDKYD